MITSTFIPFVPGTRPGSTHHTLTQRQLIKQQRQQAGKLMRMMVHERKAWGATLRCLCALTQRLQARQAHDEDQVRDEALPILQQELTRDADQAELQRLQVQIEDLREIEATYARLIDNRVRFRDIAYEAIEVQTRAERINTLSLEAANMAADIYCR